MQTAINTASRNTVAAIAAVMREHPGSPQDDIRRIGNFTQAQMEKFGEKAAELAGQQSETRI